MNEAQLTAYALNQLSDAERSEVERHFSDEAARQAIREEASVAQRLREAHRRGVARGFAATARCY